MTTPAKPFSTASIEDYLLRQAQWEEGTMGGHDISGRHMTAKMGSLRLTSNTGREQRLARGAAVAVLSAKWDIGATVTRSESMGGVDVLRVVNEGPFHNYDKLVLAKRMSADNAWKENLVKVGQRYAPAVNLILSGAGEAPTPIGQNPNVQFAKDRLEAWGIPHEVTLSNSLDDRPGKPGVWVLRVAGEDNIARLRHQIPSVPEPRAVRNLVVERKPWTPS